MSEQSDMIRYSVIEEKNPREIVLLRGSGCAWKKCRFCNYHLDYSADEKSNYELNRSVLEKVTGKYQKLEVINSGSFFELDTETMQLIEEVCVKNEIHELHFESHWMFREQALQCKRRFAEKGITVKMKIGVETFDEKMREENFVKGIGSNSPAQIAQYFDEVCLLLGVEGQTLDSMRTDIETGLNYFERVCINIMVENGMPVKPDAAVIAEFRSQLYPIYIENDRVDILMENTDFGVGD